MQIKELMLEEFKNFVDNHPLRNYCQTVNYALMMGQYDYEYELIGLVENNRILGASLILTKKLGFKAYFAYAPKGFLIDYTNAELVTNFINLLKAYYAKKHFTFIKINPEIAIGEINPKTHNVEYNNNYQINQVLQTNGFKNVGVNQDFDETLFPTFTGIVSLKNFGINSIAKNTRNKVRKGIRMGLKADLGTIKDLKTIKNYFPKIDDYYYDDLYNSFEKNDMIDIIKVYIDPQEYLQNVQAAYECEMKKNRDYGQRVISSSTPRNINKKMNSDRALLSYKNEIIEATKLAKENIKTLVAGALIIKDSTRIQIVSSGYNKNYKHFVPNYYLYYAILNYYKDNYSYADLNGISNRLNKDNKYYGLNKFKLGFKPKVYELIGEHDLILNQTNYKLLFEDSFLARLYKKL